MYDVLIIGGGPAGLSAALALGRCRRKVLICDKGEPRNRSAKALHGFLTRDGINPLEFLRLGREELLRYENVRFRQCEVTAAEHKGRHFVIHSRDAPSDQGRILLLATGIVDELPDLPDIERFYGRSVHHCPYCDGWEHRDQPLAVLGVNHDTVDLAIELLGWSEHVVLCTNGEALASSGAKKLRRCNIEVDSRRIIQLRGEGDMLEALAFSHGKTLPCSALFFSPRQKLHGSLGAKLGCKIRKNGQIDCDASQTTSIPGVFAVGNASPGLQLVIIAAAEGTKAAFAINHELQKADLTSKARQ